MRYEVREVTLGEPDRVFICESERELASYKRALESAYNYDRDDCPEQVIIKRIPDDPTSLHGREVNSIVVDVDMCEEELSEDRLFEIGNEMEVIAGDLRDIACELQDDETGAAESLVLAQGYVEEALRRLAARWECVKG